MRYAVKHAGMFVTFYHPPAPELSDEVYDSTTYSTRSSARRALRRNFGDGPDADATVVEVSDAELAASERRVRKGR